MSRNATQHNENMTAPGPRLGEGPLEKDFSNTGEFDRLGSSRAKTDTKQATHMTTINIWTKTMIPIPL
jgi:hypothetical protein